jgi:hypothetical protein
MVEETHPSERYSGLDDSSGSGLYTRVLAGLVLVPTLPMLLFSVAALALFYLAPARFGGLISRLPGESIIRSVLVFAPATLFAVVVLAILYVIDRPGKGLPGLALQAVEEAEKADGTQVVRWGRLASGAVFLVSMPALLFSVALWALSFISPTRYARLLEPLPGDAYLQELVPVMPFLLFAIMLVAVILTFSSDPDPGTARMRSEAAQASRVERWNRNAPRLTDISVGMLLVVAVPMFLASLGVFGVYLLSPGRIEDLLRKMPFDEIIRLGLAFAPVALLAVVVLAFIYLVKPGSTMAASEPAEGAVRTAADSRTSLRSLLAVWLLVGGLSLSTVLGLGLVSATAYLLLR